MFRLLFLCLLLLMPLFATNSPLVKIEGANEKSLILSNSDVAQKSQNASEISMMLILLGLAFMMAELFVPGFGILGIAGVIAFASGSLLLIEADSLWRDISIPLIIAFSLCSLAFFLLVMKLFARSRSQKLVSGVDEMIGADAEVIDVKERGYLVRCHGERWSATSDSKLSIGQRVRVIELLGLTLRVKPAEE